MASSYMWPSPFLSILKGTQTGLGEREVGGQLLHGDIPFSVLSERKTDRARKKREGVANSDMGPSILLCSF